MAKKTARTRPQIPADLPEGLPSDLSHAGEIVEKAIEHMTDRNLDEMAIASALLGGALSLLADCMPDEGIVAILESAIESVEAGDLHQESDDAGDAPS